MNSFEYGYTPKNLKNLLKDSNLSTNEVLEIIGKSRNMLSHYMQDIDNKNHVSMSHKDWIKLVNAVRERFLEDAKSPYKRAFFWSKYLLRLLNNPPTIASFLPCD